MKLPLQVTFRGPAPSLAIRRRVREEALHIERPFPLMNGCRVAAEAPHRSAAATAAR